MLEALNLVRNHTHICSFRKYTFWYQGCLNFADVSIFLAKKIAKIVPILKVIVSELC